MGHVLKPLAKSAYMSLGVTAAASAGIAKIHEKKYRIWKDSISNFKRRNG